MQYPTPHGDKLKALLENEKLPESDRKRVEDAIDRYAGWLAEIETVAQTGDDCIEPLLQLLDSYKISIDLDLVFDSPNDFLYRQKGQLKIDNTVLEEFLPRLVGTVFSERLMELDLILGPANAFSQLRFNSNLLSATAGAGMVVRSKDHDFSMARPLFLKVSHHEDFSEFRETKTHLAFLAAEIKTNLDKTMFQEASGTAYDLKLALPNSKYFLLCEWLDMTPISAAGSAIEEVIVLRKARRLPAHVRRQFSTAAGRANSREGFQRYLREHPFSEDSFERFLSHIESLLGKDDENERDVLDRGWF